jgi:hypothetical protein
MAVSRMDKKMVEVLDAWVKMVWMCMGVCGWDVGGDGVR